MIRDNIIYDSYNLCTPLHKLIDNVHELDPRVNWNVAWHRIRMGREDAIVKLPEGCAVSHDDLPKFLYYLFGVGETHITRRERNRRKEYMYFLKDMYEAAYKNYVEHS